MKKAVYLVVGILMVNSIFGSAYVEEDFNQIPQLGFLNVEQIRTLIRKGSINIADRTWDYVPDFILRDVSDPNEFLAALPSEQSVIQIEEIGETVHEPFFVIGERLVRLVRLKARVKKSESIESWIHRVLFVSTNIDSSFAENPLVRLTGVERIEDVIYSLTNRSGAAAEMLQTIFQVK